MEHRSPDSTRVVIQGFGNVGSNAAARAADLGFKVVGVSDVTGGIYNPNGLDIRAVQAYAAERGDLRGYAEGDLVTNGELLALPCEVLIPAAMEGQLTGRNADRVQARLVVEGANGPTEPEADDILNDRGVVVVPDILANAGGVIVSYFEWVQDLQAFFWDEDEIFRQLDRQMVRVFASVERTAEEYEVDMRTAAQIHAIKRVAEALMTRGIYP
jgi:glutamate dehydrogenase (NAD(P)+)